MKNRLLFLVLVLSFAGLLLMSTAVSYAYGWEHQRIITNIGELKDYENHSTLSALSFEERSDFIYFGKLDNKPIKWVVLSKNGSGGAYNGCDSNRVMFLMSYGMLGSSNFHGYLDPNGGGYNVSKAVDLNSRWAVSKTKEWCGNFVSGDSFSKQEKSAIVETTKASSYSSSAPSDMLIQEKLFLLSYNEVKTYLPDVEKTSTGSSWWLRTAGRWNESTVLSSDSYYVSYDGKIYSTNTHQTKGCRPGMNLNKDLIILLSKAGENKNSVVGKMAKVTTFEGNEWKVTLFDSDRWDFSASLGNQVANKVTINYSGALVGENEYVSALIKDSSNNVKYYGKIKNVASASDSSGKIEITLPQSFAEGDTLYVFQENEADDTSTCYSSFLRQISNVKPDTETFGFASGDFIEQKMDLTGDMGDSLEVEICNAPQGETITAESDKSDVAGCKVEDGKLKVSCLMDGEDKITVSVGETELVANVKVNKNYTKKENVTVQKGKFVTITDESGTYADTYEEKLLNNDIASVAVSNITTAAEPATNAKVEKLTQLKSGKYILGTSSGRYFTVSGTRVGTTSDPAKAAEWTLSGSSDNVTMKNGSYYLSHSTSGVSLSTSTSNASWKYSSSNGFYFTQSTRRMFRTTTTTYYLNGNPGVSTSTSNLAAAYTYTPGTPAVEGKTATEIKISGAAAGNTNVIVGSTLYCITVKPEPITQTITVKIVDDIGVALKDSYEISGVEGTSYTITPEPISGYTTPAKVNGTFASQPKGEITLVYTLNTDKSKLQSAIANKENLKQSDYTVESWSAYESAVTAGQAVFNKERATQSEVDTALSNINTAYGSLKLNAATTGYSLDKDGIDSGNEYIIVYSGKALRDNNGSIGSSSVTVKNDNIASVDDSCVWIVTKSGSGTTIKNKKTGRYLKCSQSGFLFFRSVSLGLASSASYWTSSQSGSKYSFYVSISNTKYYLSGTFSAAKSTSNANMQLYKKI